MLYLVTAQVRPANTGGEYRNIVFGSRDNEVRNHNTRLQGEGYEVLDVKVEPWNETLDVVPADDEELYEQNSTTTETTGSSD
jgi:hypothetical protein